MTHLTQEQLGAYLDRALTGRALDEARRHLESCASCRDALASLSTLDAELRPALTHDPGEGYFETFSARVEDRIRAAGLSGAQARGPAGARSPVRGWSPSRLAWASGIAVVLVGAGLVLLVGRDVKPPELRQSIPGVEQSKSLTPPAAEAPLAAGTESEAEPDADEAVDRTAARDRAVSDLAPTPSPSMPPTAAAPARQRELRRNESGDQVEVRREGFAAPPATTPAGSREKTADARGVRVRKPGVTLFKQGEESAASKAQESIAPGEANQPGAEVQAQKRADTRSLAGQSRLEEAGEATLCGRITDSDGRPLRGVQVALGGRTVSTDATGRYCLSAPPGRHELVAMTVGFQPTRQTIVVGGESAEANLVLRAVSVLDQPLAIGSGEKEKKDEADKSTWGAIKAPHRAGRAGEGIFSFDDSMHPDPLADPFRGLSASLRATASRARNLELIGARDRSASSYDQAATEWERLRARIRGRAEELPALQRVAEDRLLAWQIAPTPARGAAARAAVTAFLAKAPEGPQREQAEGWREQLQR